MINIDAVPKSRCTTSILSANPVNTIVGANKGSQDVILVNDDVFADPEEAKKGMLVEKKAAR